MLAPTAQRVAGFAATVLVLLAGAGTPFASAAQQPPSVRLSSDVAPIPFELIDNRVVFTGRVNESDPLVFVLDTGARASVVFGPIGDSLGLSFVGQARVGNGGGGVMAPVAMGGSIQLSPDVEINNEMIVAMLEEDFSSRLGFETDGITGAALFTNTIVSLDFERGVFTVHRSLPEIDDDAARIPVTVEDGGVPYAVLDVELADGSTVRAKLVVDLGQGQSMSLNVGSDPAIQVPDEALHTPVYATRFDGSGVGGHFGRIKSLHLGQHVLTDIVASFPEAESQIERAERQGSIGAEVLRRFHVVFDYAGGFMYLTPNGSFDDPFEIDMSGLRLTAEDGAVRVESVAHGSVGNAAGLEPGDEIVEIDGATITWRSLPDIRRLFRSDGRTLRVSFIRDGERQETVLRLERRI